MLVGVAGATWVVVVASGLALLMRYQMTPGIAAAATAARWPASAGISLSRDRDTLVLFLHPQCPCSRATIEELNRLLTRRQGKIEALVFLFQPPDQPESWSHTSLWREAQAIPGVRVRADSKGTMASRFGAGTSGETFLYDRTGRLLFQGGITGSRGHAGDNAGVDAVLALTQVDAAAPLSPTRTPTFGCALTASIASGEEGAKP